MAKIENYKYSIEEAFRECFYIVPDYQREYVWTDEEVQQLLDDVDDQINEREGREYFIGTILVAPTKVKNHFEVIDGQQRLTTCFLLLCVLKNLFRGDPHEQSLAALISTAYTSTKGEALSSLKLDPRYENAGAVLQRIVAVNSEPIATRADVYSAGIKSFGSLENLLTAYSTLHTHISKTYQTTASLRKYWGYLANNVVFIQISADVSSALKIFETINERGIGLNSMDLLKNLLFRNVRTSEFARLKDEWKKITKPLESGKHKPLRFLRYFLMASYKIETDPWDSVVREDEIYDWLTTKENAKVCNYEAKPFEFVRKITESVEHYIDFAHGRGNDGKASVAMGNLHRLCGSAFSLHYILLMPAAKLPKTLFDHFVAQLESFLFYYIFTKTPTRDLERSFSIWADELRAIASIQDRDQQTEQLDRFIKLRFATNMKSKHGELADALRRYTLDSMQVYRTRYLLAKFTQYVDIAYKGLKKGGSLEEYTVLEIEHILPNTPEQDLLADFAKKNPGSDYRAYKTKLGNLTLLEKPINIVASNDFFSKKKREYLKCKYYLTSSIAELTTVGKNSSITRINKKLRAFDDWQSADIDARQDMLIRLADDIWTVSTKA